MKKILALVLMVAMLCCMMVSCEKTDALLEKADDALVNAPYKVTMKTTFKADNPELNAALAANAVEIPIIIDGENVSMDMSIPALGIQNSKIVVVDKVLYMLVEAQGITVKYKCTLTDEQFEQFMADNNATMPIEHKYFDKKDTEKDGSKKIITCSELNQDGKDMLKERAQKMLAALGNDSEADYDEIQLELIIEDGKYASQEIEMDYDISVEGVSFSVSATTKSSYDYDEDYKVTAPEDADSYTEMEYEDLFPN